MYLACDPKVENCCSLMRKGPIDFFWEMELCPGLWQERVSEVVYLILERGRGAEGGSETRHGPQRPTPGDPLFDPSC